MSQLQNVTWEQYEAYCHCPQMWAWDFRTPKPQGTQGDKDTQYLTRGNAIQNLVDLWATSGPCWDDPDNQKVRDFVSTYALKAVREAWIEDTSRGRPKITPMEMTVDVIHTFMRTLPLLRDHIYKQSREGPPKAIHPQYEIEGEGPFNLRLRARLDLLVITQEDKAVIYEGKATKYINKTGTEQVRWQGQILKAMEQRDTKPPWKVTTSHYFVFFTAAEIREVVVSRFLPGERGFCNILSVEQEQWMEDRDLTLKGMFEGAIKARPSSSACYICKFNTLCPDRYQPTKRDTTPSLPVSPKGIKVNVLD